MAYANNERMAAIFRETAALLKAQGADIYRQEAYKKAAATIEGWSEDLEAILQRAGSAGLLRLPNIGRSLAASIEEFIFTGHCRTLDRLRGRHLPEDLFAEVPGIGKTLAARIHQQLLIDTLEELESAAHDGRLATVAGIGDARAQAIADHLRARLDASSRRAARARPLLRRHQLATEPLSIAAVLEIDRLYRARVETGDLPLIAPLRFNAHRSAWMPVWHADREDWALSVMPSNSAQAHRLGKTHDWTLIVAVCAGHEEQFTVVTEFRGDLEGLRVVRGHEAECRALYASPLEGVGDVVHHLAEVL